MTIRFVSCRKRRSENAFTLIELLTAMAILSVMMVAAATMLSQTQQVWSSSKSRISQFRDARLAFELITRNLGQSTLNTYWDYVYDSKNTPTDYQRKSELHFLASPVDLIFDGKEFTTHAVFFQAVLGYSRNSSFQRLDTLLNGRGYFIQFGDDGYQRPAFLDDLDVPPPPKWRFQLMEFVPPTERNLVYRSDYAVREGNGKIEDWFSEEVIKENSRAVVENVIALIVSPRRSAVEDNLGEDVHNIAPLYRYDSRDEKNADTLNILPPLVEVTLVAIDEASAVILQDRHGEEPPALVDKSWFREAGNYEKDLVALEERLVDQSINYRVFTTTVAIRSAKWSH